MRVENFAITKIEEENKLDSDRFKIIGTFVVIFLVLCGYFYFTQGRQNIQQTKIQKQQQLEQAQNNSQISTESAVDTSAEKKSGIYYKVHVAGEVKNPGVYSLDSTDRVIDAIEIAGGNTENADLDRINLAEYIKDGEKIRVPSISERTSSSNNLLGNYDLNSNKIEDIISDSVNTNSYNLNSKSNSELININTATVSKLEELPGVGATIANSIVSYRQENGGFKSIDEIKQVPRIGDKTYDKLKDLITVD